MHLTLLESLWFTCIRLNRLYCASNNIALYFCSNYVIYAPVSIIFSNVTYEEVYYNIYRFPSYLLHLIQLRLVFIWLTFTVINYKII